MHKAWQAMESVILFELIGIKSPLADLHSTHCRHAQRRQDLQWELHARSIWHGRQNRTVKITHWLPVKSL